MAGKKITIKDIARVCGVGLGTASRAINGKPGVRPDVRRKVLNYVEEIGWRCNSVQQRLTLPATGRAVAFIASTAAFEPRYNAELLRVLMESLPVEGYAPAVYYGHCRENLERAIASRPHAVVLAGVHDYQAPLACRLVEGGTRVIGLGDCEEAACPLVAPDATAAAARAVRHLRQAGHRHIGLLAGMGNRRRLKRLDEVNVHFVRQVLRGILQADPEFPLGVSAVSDCFSDLGPLRRQLRSGRHSAWICSDEKMVRQLLHCARELGLSIPEDLSVIALTPELPWYAFEQDLTRLHPDNPAQAAQVLELLAAEPSARPSRLGSDYRFHAGATVASPR